MKKTFLLTFLLVISIGYSQVPGSAAPTPPTRDAGDVISLFTQTTDDTTTTYSDISVSDFNPNWGSTSGNVTIDAYGGDRALTYPSFNYQGIVIGSNIDVSSMTTLHVDVWTNSLSPNVFLISASTGEKSVNIPTNAGSWSSIDIPLSSFTSQGMSINDIKELKFDGGDSSTSIYIDNIYFWKPVDGTDATLSDLKVDTVTITGFNSNTEAYTVSVNPSTIPTITATANDATANVAITQASAIPGNATVVVTAQNGTTTKTYTVSFVSSIPGSAALTPPTRDASDVISLFTQTTDDTTTTYSDISVSDFNPNWGSTSGNVTIDAYGGDRALTYPSFNYQGIVIGSNIDVSSMTTLHVDVWTNSLSPNVFLISASTGEKSVNIPANAGSWSSIDIPLSSFTSQGMSINDIKELKFDGGDSSTSIYIDNIYFWKTPTVVGTDATLSDLQVDGTTITNFSSGTETYTYGLVEGTSVVPTVTATTTDAGAVITSITAASSIPGTTEVLVTAADGTTTKTYTVSFAITIPASSPVVPSASPSDVISLFSNSYTDVTVDTWRTSWSTGNLEELEITTGNDAKKYTNMGFVGVETVASVIDVSTMNYFSFDYWTPDATEIKIKLVDFGANGVWEASGDNVEHELTYTSTQGSWQTLKIPLSDFTGLTTLEHIAQYIFSGSGSSTIYIDNVYFSKRPLATWDGSDDTDWNTAANWDTNVVPTVEYDVTIPSGPSNQPVVSATTGATAYDLTIDGSLTINSGGSLIALGTSTGSILYKRTLTADADSGKAWYLLSSPVTGQTVVNFIANNTLASGTTNTNFRGIANYKNDGTDWNYYLVSYAGADAFDAGKGYSVKNAAAGDVTFTGTYTSGNKDFSISQATNNFNLTGNPYAAYINLGTFFTDNNAVDRLSEQTIWLWDQSANAGTGGYEQKMAGTDATFEIAPGQGFFVSAGAAATNNVTFNATNQSHQTDSFLRSSRPEVHLNIAQNDLQHQTKIYYIEGTTTGFDNGYDGSMFGGVSYDLAVFTELVANSQGERLGIQSLPDSDYESMIIPVGLIAEADSEITFSVDALNLPTDIKVFLEDKVTNTFTRLDEANTEYTITLAEALNGIGRFYLHTSTSALSIDTATLNTINIYKSDISTVRIASLPQGNTTVKLFNVLGKQLMNTTFEANGVKDISLPKLATGIYIVAIQTEVGKLNKKIILE